jgi:hypothetical protein
MMVPSAHHQGYTRKAYIAIKDIQAQKRAPDSVAASPGRNTHTRLGSTAGFTLGKKKADLHSKRFENLVTHSSL